MHQQEEPEVENIDDMVRKYQHIIVLLLLTIIILIIIIIIIFGATIYSQSFDARTCMTHDHTQAAALVGDMQSADEEAKSKQVTVSHVHP